MNDPFKWFEAAGIEGLVIGALIFVIIKFIHHIKDKDKSFLESLEKRDNFFVDAITEQRKDSRSYVDNLVKSHKEDREEDRRQREDDRRFNQTTHDRLSRAIDNLTIQLENKNKI